MNHSIRLVARGLAILGLTALTACGGVRTKTFQVRAVDNDKDKVLPCVYVVEGEWPQTEQDAQDRLLREDVNSITLQYRSGNDLQLELVPVTLGPDGNIQRIPKRGDTTDYDCRENPRVVRWTDPGKLLFVFWRKSLNAY